MGVPVVTDHFRGDVVQTPIDKQVKTTHERSGRLPLDAHVDNRVIAYARKQPRMLLGEGVDEQQNSDTPHCDVHRLLKKATPGQAEERPCEQKPTSHDDDGEERMESDVLAARRDAPEQGGEDADASEPPEHDLCPQSPLLACCGGRRFILQVSIDHGDRREEDPRGSEYGVNGADSREVEP